MVATTLSTAVVNLPVWSGRGRGSAAAQDTKYNQDSRKSAPAYSSTDALAFREIQLVAGGRTAPERSGGVERSSSPRLSCCQRLPRSSGDTTPERHEARAGRRSESFAPLSSGCHPLDPQSTSLQTTDPKSSAGIVGARLPPLPAPWPPRASLTGRIQGRCCSCSSRPCSSELPTPAPSGNPGHREHQPLSHPGQTQTLLSARAHLPRLARPGPRPSLVGQPWRRTHDARPPNQWGREESSCATARGAWASPLPREGCPTISPSQSCQTPGRTRFN